MLGMTWKGMIEMEPNLEDLAERLQKFDAESDHTKNMIWAAFGKPAMLKLVGSMAEPSVKEKRHPRINGCRKMDLSDNPPATPPDPRMITSDAYDIAYRYMLDALKM